MKLPNLITLSRLLLSPLFLVAFRTGGEAGLRWALVLAVFFEVTDMVDGFLARRFRQTTQLGQILDPLADSISRFTVFLAFLDRDWASVWAVAPIFWRDSIVSTLRVLAASQGVIVSARFWGKAKAILQGTAIIALLLVGCLREEIGLLVTGRAWTEGDVQELSRGVMGYVALITVISLWDYLYGNLRILRKLEV